MHFLVMIQAVTLLVVLVCGTVNDQYCSSVSTVTVTVSATHTVTETGCHTSQPATILSPTSLDIYPISGSQSPLALPYLTRPWYIAGHPDEITATRTVFATATQPQTQTQPQVSTSNLNLAAAITLASSLPSVSSDAVELGGANLYSFFVTGGTTEWIGRSAPGTGSFVLVTTAITVDAVPTRSWVLTGGEGHGRLTIETSVSVAVEGRTGSGGLSGLGGAATGRTFTTIRAVDEAATGLSSAATSGSSTHSASEAATSSSSAATITTDKITETANAAATSSSSAAITEGKVLAALHTSISNATSTPVQIGGLESVSPSNTTTSSKVISNVNKEPIFSNSVSLLPTSTTTASDTDYSADENPVQYSTPSYNLTAFLTSYLPKTSVFILDHDIASTSTQTTASTQYFSFALTGYRPSRPTSDVQDGSVRQLGKVITATVDGVVVSWVNNYEGPPQSVAVADEISSAAVTGVQIPVLESVPDTSISSFVVGSFNSSTVSLSESVMTAVTAVSDSTPTDSASTDSASTDSTTTDSTPTSATRLVLSGSSITTFVLVADSSVLAGLATSLFSSVTDSPILISSAVSTFTSDTNSPILISSAVSSFPSETDSPVLTSSAVSSFPSETDAPVLTSSAASSLIVSSLTIRFPKATSSLASASSPTATCSQPFLSSGKFTINFDDLPRFGASPDVASYPPIFSPYHKLFWSEGFAYVPPPRDPFLPVSPPQLAIFVVDGRANTHSRNFTGIPPPSLDVNGEFGAGPRYANPAFWIDAYAAYLGCNNPGPANCQLRVDGYGYDVSTEKIVLKARTYAYQPACPGLSNCALVPFAFTDEFRHLTGVQIVATLEGSSEPIAWFMDDLEVGWSFDDCAAGEERYHAA